MMTTYGLEFMNMIINPWLSDAHTHYTYLAIPLPTYFIVKHGNMHIAMIGMGFNMDKDE